MQNEKQSSIPRFGPKRGCRESIQISTHQSTDERVVITPQYNNVPHRTEGRSQSKRAVSAPGRVPSRTTGSAHNHRLATMRDVLTLRDQEGLKGQKYTARISNNLKCTRKTIILNAMPRRRKATAKII